MAVKNKSNKKKSKKQKRLGRGLSALFEETNAVYAEGEEAGSIPKNATELPIEMLSPGPFQPRQDFDEVSLSELAQSIRINGLIQSIIVRKDPDNEGKYQIIAGERRWRASQKAQLHNVPVVIKDISDVQAMEISLVENLQRQDLNAIEEARGYKRLVSEFTHTQEELAKSMGKSRSHVANMLRILKLPQKVQEKIEFGQLSFGHAKALMAMPEEAEKNAAIIISKNLSVRQTEALVSRLKKGVSGENQPQKSKKPINDEVKDADTIALENSLTAKLGLKVTIDHKTDAESGNLRIDYISLDQLDDIIQRLMS